MSTVSDIVLGAMRLLGVTTTTDTTRQANGLTAYNSLIASWGLNNLLPYCTVTDNKTLTAGTASYTIGSSGSIDTVRPARILSAYIQDSSGTDYPLEVMNVKDYNEISDKDASAKPERINYKADNPLGTVYLDCAPDAAYVLYITSLKPYSAAAALTETVDFPLEYEKALKYNLAVDLAPEHGINPNPLVIQQAVILKSEIENMNAVPFKESSFDNGMIDGFNFNITNG